MRRGRTLATQSRQRITGFGKFGIGFLIPPGCGKLEHLRLSALLQSPFNLVSDVDDDTEFVPSVKRSWDHTLVLFDAFRKKL